VVLPVLSKPSTAIILLICVVIILNPLTSIVEFIYYPTDFTFFELFKCLGMSDDNKYSLKELFYWRN